MFNKIKKNIFIKTLFKTKTDQKLLNLSRDRIEMIQCSIRSYLHSCSFQNLTKTQLKSFRLRTESSEDLITTGVEVAQEHRKLPRQS